MNRYYFIWILFVALVACDDQIPGSFEDIAGVYFNNRLRNNVLVDSTDVTFVYENADTLDVPVIVQLLGRPAEQPRPVDIRITTDGAAEGVDYVLKTAAEMPANSASFNYIVMLKRTAALKQKKYTLTLELKANDYFSLPLLYEVQAGGDSTSILRYRISFTDQFTVAPIGWQTEFVGEFTQQKFELLCRVLEIPPADFDVKGKITLAKWIYIQTEINAYVAEQVQKKADGETYDTEAFDRQTGEPLEF